VAAIRWLNANPVEGQRVPHASTLTDWSRTTHWERYEQIRDQMAPQTEKTIANDMREAAREALEATRLAVEKARERLEANRDPEPAKSAAALSKVTASSMHDLMMVTDRPTQRTESRGVEEILRGLVAKGYLQLTDEKPALEGSSDDAGD
jgi:hypothetical protein